VAVNNTLPSYWDFIQISGIAMVHFTVVGTIGQPVSVDPTATPPVPILGGTLNDNFIGTTRLTAPIANALSPVELNILQGYNF
jgi:hypothetical protein